MPGLVPPYQNAIAIADSANALNAKGKWKYRNTQVKPAATATETNASPYAMVGWALHFAFSGYLIVALSIYVKDFPVGILDYFFPAASPPSPALLPTPPTNPASVSPSTL